MLPGNRINAFSLLLQLYLSFAVATLFGQQINVGTPLNSVSDSFYENLGVNFGFSFPGGQGPGSRVVGYNGFGLTPNINFSQGGSGAATPGFGGYSPNSGARFGFANLSGGGGFSLGFHLAQGNSRTLSSTSPSVTLMNGGVGFIGSGAFSPYVTGIIPVVGDEDQMDNAVTRGIASGQLRPYSESSRSDSMSKRGARPSPPVSSATVADIGVAEIKAQRALARTNRLKQLDAAVAAAEMAQGRGDYRNARIELRKALKLVEDADRKKKLKNWMKTLRGK